MIVTFTDRRLYIKINQYEYKTYKICMKNNMKFPLIHEIDLIEGFFEIFISKSLENARPLTADYK